MKESRRDHPSRCLVAPQVTIAKYSAPDFEPINKPGSDGCSKLGSSLEVAAFKLFLWSLIYHQPLILLANLADFHPKVF